MDRKEIDSLKHARAANLDSSRPDIVTRVHNTGRMTARERAEYLLDDDSEVEYGRIAAKSQMGAWIPEAGGVDFVGTVDGHPTITSSTDYTDHGGGYGAGRLGRLFGLAREHRWPVVLFVDGGGSRARHPRAGQGDIETSGSMGRFSFLDGAPEISGWAPFVSIVSGPSFAGHASLAGFSDFLISTPGSSIGMGGPPMVEAALGVTLKPNELAGSEMHEVGGGIDLLVENELAAIEAARKYLSYYYPMTGAYEAADIDLDRDVPMRQVIEGICDAESLFELRPNFARSLLTLFGRIEGNTVGIMANQPLENDGYIDQDAATKISRFVELCNTYEYPMLSFIDTPGCMASWPVKKQAPIREPGFNRWHARPIIAHQQRTTPMISVQVGRADGMASALMTGVSSTRGVPALKLAWPSVELGLRDGYAAVVDHNAFDDVIVPSETRRKVARLLRLFGPAVRRSVKKQAIDTW